MTANKNNAATATVPEATSDLAPVTPIAKPGAFDLNKFKSTRPSAIAGVETLLTGLPHFRISEAKDFVRLHPHEVDYWSIELCFVNVPIKGARRDTLHLIEEALAMQYLESARIDRFRLALASKPNDVFFLCHVPSQNLDNRYNETSLDGCTQAKTHWVQVTSRRGEGVDEYKVTFAREQDAFPDPQWPTQSLAELIEKTFEGRMIDRADHPGLLRLVGAKPIVS
jgi:hypothetical protein